MFKKLVQKAKEQKDKAEASGAGSKAKGAAKNVASNKHVLSAVGAFKGAAAAGTAKLSESEHFNKAKDLAGKAAPHVKTGAKKSTLCVCLRVFLSAPSSGVCSVTVLCFLPRVLSIFPWLTLLLLASLILPSFIFLLVYKSIVPDDLVAFCKNPTTKGIEENPKLLLSALGVLGAVKSPSSAIMSGTSRSCFFLILSSLLFIPCCCALFLSDSLVHILIRPHTPP